MDSPWQRLPWTLPAALLIWAAALVGLAYFMGKPTQRLAEPPPIEAQLLDQYVPPGTGSSHPEPPAAVSQPQPVPQVRPQPAPRRPLESHRAKKKPAPPEEAVTTKATAAPSGAPAMPGVGQAAVKVKTSGNTGAQAGSDGGTGPAQGSMSANSGARALIHPMPQIPEDLRGEAFNSAALVRFHIAVDGSVEVELVQPTPNPVLNRILLDSLKKWRFMPAIQSGKPVATTEEILVKIQVR